MKIISLNTWNGGRLEKEVTNFFRNNAVATDMFCLQECEPGIEVVTNPLLDTHECLFDIKQEQQWHGEDYYIEQMFFYKKNIRINQHTTRITESKGTGLAQMVQVGLSDRSIDIYNMHGYAFPGDKLDNANRLRASKEIIDSIQIRKNPAIVIGDFNLDINTESVKMFSKNGMRNLIEEYNIETTRNMHVWKHYPEDKQMYADYAFVTKEIDVVSFTVPEEIVSDHLPLYLEIK